MILRLVAKRALFGVLTLLAVSVLVFVATQALPGNAAVAKLGNEATPQAVAAFEENYNLSDPIWSQYLNWLGNLAQGDLGVSFVNDLPVSELISQRLGNTLVLTLAAAFVGLPLGIAIGIFAAMRRDRVFDHASGMLMLASVAVPEFVVALLLVIVFATNVLDVLPAVSVINPNESVLSQLDRLVLPTLTLAIAIVPYAARIIRASMIDVLESDYVAMARLKGLPEGRVILRHAFPNAAGPLCQVIAIILAALFGGVVVVETAFQYPGIGQALVEAVTSRNLPVVQVLVLAIATVYVVVNVLADVATILVTPRLRVENQ